MIQTNFHKLFAGIDLSAEELKSLEVAFFLVVFYEILSVGNQRLNKQERESIAQLMKENKINEAIEEVKAKFNQEEWNNTVKTITESLLKDYSEKVLKK